MIHKVCVYHGDGITYSPDDYYLQAVSSDGMLNVPANTFTDANGVMEATNFSGSLFSAIECKDVFINWRLVKRATGETIKIGETKHKLYVVKGSLDEIPFHTVVDFSCSAARGLSADEDIIDAIWTKLQTLRVIREDGGLPFKYWGDISRSININNTESLIAYRDGRCNAWADFVKDLFKIQGITVKKISFCADYYEGDNDQNEYIIIYHGHYMTDISVSVFQSATSFQGGISSAGPFNMHYINEINGKFYDATCGRGPYNTKTEYLRNNIKMYYDISDQEHRTVSGDKLYDYWFTWSEVN